MTIRTLMAGITTCLALFGTSCGENGASPAQKPAANQAASDTPAGEAAKTPATGASALPDPCRLLTDDEVSTVLRPTNNGYTVSGRKFMPFPEVGGGQCDIEVKNLDGFSATFSISVSPEGKGSLFIERGTRRPIPGMGAEAFEVGLNSYAIANGVLLHVVNVPGDRQRGAAALLRIAMGKL